MGGGRGGVVKTYHHGCVRCKRIDRFCARVAIWGGGRDGKGRGTNSKGKLPRSGGVGFWAFARPPGPPKDIFALWRRGEERRNKKVEYERMILGLWKMMYVYSREGCRVPRLAEVGWFRLPWLPLS